jgi:hypothetical protein
MPGYLHFVPPGHRTVLLPQRQRMANLRQWMHGVPTFSGASSPQKGHLYERID